MVKFPYFRSYPAPLPEETHSVCLDTAPFRDTLAKAPQTTLLVQGAGAGSIIVANRFLATTEWAEINAWQLIAEIRRIHQGCVSTSFQGAGEFWLSYEHILAMHSPFLKEVNFCTLDL